MRYEVPVSITTGNICSVFVPFLCRFYPDVCVFRLRMKKELEAGERVIADKGHRGPACLLRTDVDRLQRHVLTNIRVRQDTVNRRFKKIVMGYGFRYQFFQHFS